MDSFLHLRNRRIAAREALSPEQRDVYDTKLEIVLRKTLRNEYCIDHDAPLRIRPILKLLNKGATAHKLNPHEHDGPNLGNLVDLLKRPAQWNRSIFKLLDHIVASPCESWVTNCRYAGNRGQILSYFLVSIVVTADIWGDMDSPYSDKLYMYDRFRAWSSLRNMIWACEQDEDNGILPVGRKRFVRYVFHDIVCSVSRREGKHPLDDSDRRLLDAVVEFFKLRSVALLQPPSEVSWLSCGPTGPFATELLLRTGDETFRNFYEDCDGKDRLNRLLMNKQTRRDTRNLLRYKEFRRWAVSDVVIRELCRRKERLIFQRLYDMDPDLLMEKAPLAIAVLESEDVRGCKGRLLEFLIHKLELVLQHEELKYMNELSLFSAIADTPET